MIQRDVLAAESGVSALRQMLDSLPRPALVAVGGTSANAKPMALLSAALSSGLSGFDLLSYAGGLDVELALNAGAVARVRSAYLGIEGLGALPSRHQLTSSNFVPETFGSIMWGLEAQARGLTFLPGPDLSHTGVATERELASVSCPFTGDVYTAWPALRPDLALIHAHSVTDDALMFLPRDFGVDRLLSKASDRLIVSVEHVSPDLIPSGTVATAIAAEETLVLHAPDGALPGGFFPYYDRDDLADYGDIPNADLRQKWWFDRFDGRSWR